MRALLSLVFISAALAENAGESAARCAACHPRETAVYLASPMGRSIGDPSAEPDGRVTIARTHSRADIRHQRSHLVLQLESAGVRGSWPVAYSVGAGLVGRTDIIRVGDYLFQSPVSWYAHPGGWDLSPGYERRDLIDVDRPIEGGCLFCHAGAVRLIPGSKLQFAADAMTPISCDRCHGPVNRHLAKPVAGTILNPARLAGASRASVCEQCHLEGEARILNPGRDWWDFQAGMKTEDVFATYVKSDGHQNHFHAVSHSEQLVESRCVQTTGDRLWCGSCHSPHAEPAARSNRITAVCLSCHQPLFSESKHRPAGECVSCHMPRLRADNVSHTAVTDHRIPRVPQQPAPERAETGFDIRAWREPPASLELRDNGMAYVEVGRAQHDLAQIRRGYELLTNYAGRGSEDTAQLETMAAVLLEFGDPKRAVTLFARAAHQSPEDAELAFSFGIALEKEGNLSSAVRELERAIRLNPSLARPYLELAHIYDAMGNQASAKSILTEYLKVMPQSLRFRLELR